MTAPAPGGGFGFDDDRWLSLAARAAAPLPLGQLLGYDILDVIGRGGQAIVYRARSAGGDTVALKRLLAGEAASPSSRRRFEREIEAVAALDHPGIVHMVGHGIDGHASVLVMEWVDGQAITTWAAGRPTRDRVALLIRVCDAVQHAHQLGVVHRDLKPANVLVDRAGDPRILDFGLAKRVEPGGEPRSRSSGGGFAGTLAYAAPEQITGGRVDARTDVHALGLLLFELLTGRLPHASAGSLADAIDAIRRDAPRPSSLVPGLDRELDTIVGMAIAGDPVARYQSVDAFAADLRRHLRGEPLLAEPPRTGYLLRKAVRRHPLAAGLILAVAVLAVTLAVVASLAAVRLAAARETAVAATLQRERDWNTAWTVVRFLEASLYLPAGAAPDQRDIHDVLASTERRLETERQRAEVAAEARLSMARVLTRLGDHAAAERQLGLVAELLEAPDAGTHPITGLTAVADVLGTASGRPLPALHEAALAAALRSDPVDPALVLRCRIHRASAWLATPERSDTGRRALAELAPQAHATFGAGHPLVVRCEAAGREAPARR